MRTLVVGSKNEAKLAAVRHAAQAYWGVEALVEGIDVPSGVTAMPLTHVEMIEGAKNRARAAFAQHGEADLGLGLEAGVADIAGNPVMMGYVAITDGKHTVVVPTAGTPLPASWARALSNGAELRPFVIASGLPYDYTKGVVGILTKGVVPRDEGFGQAVKTALVPWVNADIFHAPATSTTPRVPETLG